MDIKTLLGDKYKDGMTVEELLSAEITVPDSADEIARLKRALDKSNSEAAETKRKLREKMSAEEAKAQADAEELEKILNENKALKRERDVSKHNARFVAMGYDAALAAETAEAIVDGDTDKVLANQQKHLETFEKRIRAEALKDTPRPTEDSTDKVVTRESLMKMSAVERHDFAQKNPDAYKKAYEK